jgi:hypothetical protein
MDPAMLAPEMMAGAAQMLVSLITTMVVAWSYWFMAR